MNSAPTRRQADRASCQAAAIRPPRKSGPPKQRPTTMRARVSCSRAVTKTTERQRYLFRELSNELGFPAGVTRVGSKQISFTPGASAGTDRRIRADLARRRAPALGAPAPAAAPRRTITRTREHHDRADAGRHSLSRPHEQPGGNHPNATIRASAATATRRQQREGRRRCDGTVPRISSPGRSPPGRRSRKPCVSHRLQP